MSWLYAGLEGDMYWLGWVTGAFIGLALGLIIGMYGMMLVYRKRIRNALWPNTGYAPNPNGMDGE